MRGFFGVALVLAGFILIYLFGALGIAAMNAAPAGLSGSAFSLPLQTLGASYPKDALCLIGGLTALGWGIYLLMQGTGAAATAGRYGSGSRLSSRMEGTEVTTGSYTRGFFLLSLGACLALGIAAIGSAANARAMVIGAFVLVAGIAFLEALVLGILTFFEQGKPVILLFVGWILFVVALGFGIAGIALAGSG